MSKTLYDEMVLHNIKLESYKTERVMQYIKQLNILNNKIKNEIMCSSSVYTKRRYNELLRLVKECSKELELTLYDDSEIKEFIEQEINYYNKLFTKYVGDSKNELVIKSIIAYLMFYPITNETSAKTYINNIVERFVNTWDMNLRTTYITKDTTKNTIKNVLGDKLMNIGSMNVVKNSIEKFTSTEIQSLEQNIIKIVSNNYDGFNGWKWTSILDTRTCISCGNIHNKEFTELKDIPFNPLHIHCRCMLIPVLANGKTPDYKDYSEWFENQTEIDKEFILGKTRYKMYKDGSSINSFVSNNKLLTLKQLNDK